jgi:hypothetical protein
MYGAFTATTLNSFILYTVIARYQRVICLETQERKYMGWHGPPDISEVGSSA